MTWRGPELDVDQVDLLNLLNDVMRDREPLAGDDVQTAADLRDELVGLGVWTAGTAQEHGGAGASDGLALLIVERLSRLWPGMAWASVQAQAAVEVIGREPGMAALLSDIHAGTAPVAVVESSSEHVRLTVDGDRVHGRVARVDPGGSPAWLVVLHHEVALVIAPASMVASPVQRSGLAGAFTTALTIHGPAAAVIPLEAAPVRARMSSGGAAIAAGLSGAAVDAAVAYSAQRTQFGRTLASIPTVQASLHEQAARTSVTLAAVMSHDTAGPRQSAGVLMHACDAAIDVASAALQVHGGYGYLKEYSPERLLRDAVSLRGASAAWGHSSAEFEASPR